MVKKKCNLNSYIYIKVQSNRSNITLYVHFCIVKRFIWCLGNCVNQFNDLDVRTITSIRALCVRLDSADSTSAFSSFAFSLFFFFYCTRNGRQRLLFMYCAWTVPEILTFQPFSAHQWVPWDPQTSLFSKFFIKNGSWKFKNV